jgi:hypothetical protein
MSQTDTCLQRKGRTKTASATVYLMEELGDARVRCDQLMRYIADAVQLIEQSEHRDHFFEVAGHLIQSVPGTAFKLQKALQAVALAADRIDYEEIKQELRPEKVEQLENVLKDVRVRQVQRRSEPPMNPKQAADALKEIAQITRETGSLPFERVLHLASQLEEGTKTASGSAGEPADLLDRLASALENPPDPEKDASRVRLAAVIRRLASDEALKIVAGTKTDDEQMAELDQEKGDKTAGIVDEVLAAKFEYLKNLAIVAYRSANGKRWKMSLVNLAQLVNSLSPMLEMFGSSKDVEPKVTAIYRAVRQTGMTAQRVMKEQEAQALAPQPAMGMVAFTEPSIQDDAGPDEVLISKFEYLRGLSILAFRNANGGRWKMALMAIAEMVEQIGAILTLFGTTDVEARIVALYREVRTTALSAQRVMQQQETHPTVSPELMAVNAADAVPLPVVEEAIEPGEPVLGRDNVLLGLDRILVSARKAGPTFESGNTKKMFFHLLGVIDGLGQVGRSFDLPEVGYLVRVYRQFARRSSGRPMMNFSAAEADKDSKFEEGKPADPTKDMSPEDAKKWKAMNDEHKDNFKSAVEGDKDSKFEEGKPADPTENLSPEDAKKWKEMHEKHKDNFKAAVEGDKDSRFEEGKPADPTENLSPEDAKKWKEMHEKHKDNFKAADWKVGAGEGQPPFPARDVTASDIRFEPDDKGLAWAYADAWPKSTLFSANLRFDINQEILAHLPNAANPRNQKATKDAWENVCQDVRNLHFRDRKWRSPADMKILVDIVPSYNEFNAKKVVAWLSKFQGIRVQAAREYSVCLYITGHEDVLREMQAAAPTGVKADESDIRSNGELRLWWD